MGGYCSDLRGGKQAVGGREASSTTAAGASEAVECFLRHRGLGGLSSEIELSFSASKLRDLDFASKSDPMAVIYIKKVDTILQEIGRTEVIMNTSDPVWVSKVVITYQFELVQPLVFRVYDVDTKYYNVPVKMLKLSDQDFLGEASCTLSEIITKNNQSIILNLGDSSQSLHKKSYGTITIHAEERVASREAVEISFRCSKLINKDFFSKSDPFLVISKIVESGGIIPICKTEVVDNNLNPVWRPVHLSMQQCGSKSNPLIIECYDFDSDGKHELIGKVQRTVSDLEKLKNDHVGVNLHAPGSHGKKLKSRLFVDSFYERIEHTFLDFITSGFELNFMVAVDFTASNGNPLQPSSLHYRYPHGGLNSYQQAIVQIGGVIEFYDWDKKFQAWGFGGRPNGGPVSHCFNLNASSYTSEVTGVEGIMSAYAMAVQNVSLAGPTLFGKVIKRSAELARKSLSNCRKYFILLILTDGVLTDLEETKEAIVNSSDLPFSILIIGIGGADFKDMEILDADDGNRLESSTGRIATRDIVQFVPMREVQGTETSMAQSLLEELPGQFLSYMRSRNIKPDSHRQPGR